MNQRVHVLLCCALLLAAVPAQVAAQPSLSADGTEFVLRTSDGRVLRSFDLVGASLKLGSSEQADEITIKDVQNDRRSVGRVLLHHFVVRRKDGATADLCAPDVEGRSLGFPVPDGMGGFELTCTSGAVGKCVRLGYRPWEEAPGGPPLKALHQACIHMIRADYGGDGRPHTRDGTLIDIYDRWGIQKSDTTAPLSFEAAWGTEGAVCVARPRISEIVTLEELSMRYAGLGTHLGRAACTEEIASRDGRTLLFNRSRE